MKALFQTLHSKYKVRATINHIPLQSKESARAFHKIKNSSMTMFAKLHFFGNGAHKAIQHNPL